MLKSSHGGAVALCLWNLSTHPDRARLGPASQYLSLFSLFTNFFFSFSCFYNTRPDNVCTFTSEVGIVPTFLALFCCGLNGWILDPPVM